MSKNGARIEVSPRVCGGKPVIGGTRIPVSVLIEQLAAGESWDDLIEGYPELTRDDLQAALKFAANQLDGMREEALVDE